VRLTKSSDAATLPVLAVSLLVSALVCWPMVGGPLLLLDWVVGGHTPVLPRTVYGLVWPR
jgi:hypothetical protein